MRAPPAPTIEAVDPRLLAAPLDFLEAEHYRFRAFFAHLDRLRREKRAAPRAATARLLLDFLARDAALHLAEEETDLFPLLRIRCRAADGIERVLALIEVERARAHELAVAVVAGLRQCARRCEPAAGFADCAAAFAAALRRDVDWENALVLPLARKRLTASDLARLSEAMAARRGVADARGSRRDGYFGG